MKEHMMIGNDNTRIFCSI